MRGLSEHVEERWPCVVHACVLWLGVVYLRTVAICFCAERPDGHSAGVLMPSKAAEQGAATVVQVLRLVAWPSMA